MNDFWQRLRSKWTFLFFVHQLFCDCLVTIDRFSIGLPSCVFKAKIFVVFSSLFRLIKFQLNFFLSLLRFGPYFVEPIVAGLDPKTSEPFVASLDLIGCPMVPEDFVVSGTCSEQMYGMCETLYRPNLVSAEHYTGIENSSNYTANWWVSRQSVGQLVKCCVSNSSHSFQVI